MELFIALNPGLGNHCATAPVGHIVASDIETTVIVSEDRELYFITNSGLLLSTLLPHRLAKEEHPAETSTACDRNKGVVRCGRFVG